MKPTEVDCPFCKGSGRVELTGVHADTLALLRGHGREASGAFLALLAGCKATAMNNRLAALERMGLAESRRYGRLRLFRPLDPAEYRGKSEPCCECGHDYPRADLILRGEIYCPKCRADEKRRGAKRKEADDAPAG